MLPHRHVRLLLPVFALAACSPAPLPAPPLDASAEQALRDGGSADAGASPDAGYVREQYVDLQRFDGLQLPRASGGRTLPMTVRWAADAPQPLPIVIWEHGGGYNPTGDRLSSDWGFTLARAGYFVIHLAHVPPNAAQLVEMCREVGVTDAGECVDLSLDGGADEETDANVFSSIAVARPTDVQRLIDGLATLAARVQQQGVTLDTTRVAVAGWSGGSQAPMQLAGALRTVSASLQEYATPDARPIAFVALSPQGPGYSGFFDTSWDTVRGPLLVATGEHDEKPANTLTGAIRRLAYDHLPAGGDKHLWYSRLDDPGIAHGSFNLGDLGSSDPELAALSTGLEAVVVGFCDAYVKGRPDAKAWLSGTGPTATAPGLIDWEHK